MASTDLNYAKGSQDKGKSKASHTGMETITFASMREPLTEVTDECNQLHHPITLKALVLLEFLPAQPHAFSPRIRI